MDEKVVKIFSLITEDPDIINENYNKDGFLKLYFDVENSDLTKEELHSKQKALEQLQMKSEMLNLKKLLHKIN